MKNYQLKSNEVVLYKGEVSISDYKGETELLLTNLYLVFITTKRKIYSAPEISVESYSVEEIKMYEGMPQIKVNGYNAEVYLLTTEKEFSFDTKSELNKFLSAATKLLTGKSTTQRGAEKIKNAISLVDDTLGINSVSLAGNAVKNTPVGKTTNIISKGLNILGKIIKK